MSGSKQHLDGKTCLITGATNGIGRVTAVGLAGMGAELFLTYRDKARADETIAEIRQKTGNDKIHLLKADLGRKARFESPPRSFSPREGRCTF